MPVYKKDKTGTKWRVRIWHRGALKDWIVDGTKKDAEAFEARKRVEMEKNGGFQEVRVVPTFLDFCVEQYRPHAEKHLKARTWTNRQYQLATLTEFFGPFKLTELSTARAEAYQNARLGEKISPGTVNDEIKVLRAVLNYAEYIGIPTVKLKIKDLPVRKKRRLHFWTKDQVATLLRSVSEHSPSLYWLVLFLLETGCRRGEALALEFCDVDLETGIVRVQPNEDWQPKDNEAREIPISKTGLLYTWLKDEATSSRRFVFVNRNKEPYAYWPQRAFDRARDAAVPPIQAQVHARSHKGALADCAECTKYAIKGGPHTTRHTFATHFLAKVPDLYLLARILGHSDTKVTQLYAHLLPDHLDRARGAVHFDAPVGVAEMKARMLWDAE